MSGRDFPNSTVKYPRKLLGMMQKLAKQTLLVNFLAGFRRPLKSGNMLTGKPTF